MSELFSPKVITDIPGNYRLMREEDIPAVFAIDEDIYPFPWTEGIFKDCITAGQLCIVNVIDHQVAAYGIVGMIVNEAHILNLSVRSDIQGKGYGREMLLYLLDLIKRNGAVRTLLEVRESNQIARKLYQSMGFEEIGVRKGYYPDHDGREDAIVLAMGIESGS